MSWENLQKVIDPRFHVNKIWFEVCKNANLNVVQFIYSLKEVQDEILKDEKGFNPILKACEINLNIKVIKYLHKLFPSFIHFQAKWRNENCTSFVLYNSRLRLSDQLNILHYLYLHGVDIHLLSELRNINTKTYQSIFTYYKNNKGENIITQYLKVISKDFDYQNNDMTMTHIQNLLFGKKLIIMQMNKQ